MILNDFVMLGKTVPEPNSDGRVFVCSAGVSGELRSLIRIYPLARPGAPSRWQRCRVPLERNPKDSRCESWKLAGDRSQSAHNQINHIFEILGKVPDHKRSSLLQPHVINSIKEANKRRISLAVIHPDAFDLTFEHNPMSPESPQLALIPLPDEKVNHGAKRFPYIPRLSFHDELGWNHLALRDWGCYELMRKHPDDDYRYARHHMADALHLTRNSSLLVGNMNNHRTTWLVISVLNGIREAPDLFSALADRRPVIPPQLRRQVYDRDEWACRQCGSKKSLVVDHNWPHIRGGNLSLENLQTLCESCNLSKSDHVDEV